MLGFCVMAPTGDALAKLLGSVVPLSILVTSRFVAQAVILAPLVLATGASMRLTPRVLALTVLRTLLHIAGIGTMFAALKVLPLADAIAIAFVMPFVMLLLGWLVLKEQVGPRRLIACTVGFAGTLMVVQPSFAEVGAPALLPLAVAVIFALFMLVTRTVARDADPLVLQAASGVVACALLIPALVLFGPDLSGFAAAGPPWAMLMGLGALGTAAHLLMTWSLRFAPTSTLAPMQYLEIPVATLIGWLIFRDFPDGLALIGIVTTIAAGIYIVMREHRLSRQAQRSRPQAPPAA